MDLTLPAITVAHVGLRRDEAINLCIRDLLIGFLSPSQACIYAHSYTIQNWIKKPPCEGLDAAETELRSRPAMGVK